MKGLNLTIETTGQLVQCASPRVSKGVTHIAKRTIILLSIFLCAAAVDIHAQEQPEPSAPKSVSVPAVKEKKLRNGLTVAVVEKRAVPLVTIQLLVKSGASAESEDKAGLADMTASLLTKGTKTRTATQIAEQIEFLGGSINIGAGWNNTSVSVTVTSDKLNQAMTILADVVLNPVFDQKELDLLRSQTLDGLTYNLKQPSFLANYVATKYSFGEHPAGGTPKSVESITRSDVKAFHSNFFSPDRAVLIFTGDVSAVAANAAALRLFGRWKHSHPSAAAASHSEKSLPKSPGPVNRLLVIDLPKSGQAAVNYLRPVPAAGRTSKEYYPASVLNSVLGGGYSSRLNQEIRIKRGLSYGAGSSFGWRSADANFSTRTQTKNESAAEVVELVLDEIKKLTESSVGTSELVPRKSVLTGSFGRNLETTTGLARAVGDLYAFDLSPTELNRYTSNVNGVSESQIKQFAAKNLLGGDIIIVGDYSIFKDDLAKRFPGLKIEVIAADDLDLSKDNLLK
ncbi:MAG: pitrilysin family protein [Pyrinomonadaceae bacterium]